MVSRYKCDTENRERLSERNIPEHYQSIAVYCTNKKGSSNSYHFFGLYEETTST